MKRINYFLGLCLMGILVALSSCSDSPKSVSLLDDDAFVIFRFDVQQLADKSGVLEDKDLKSQMTDMLEESGLSKKAVSLIKEVIEDPAKSGLDLRDPVFMTIKPIEEKTEYGTMQGVAPVIVGTVHSASDFTEFVNTLAKESDADKVVEKDDLYCFVNGDMGLIYDGGSFIITSVSRGDDPEDVIKDFKDRFDGKDAGKLAEDADFQAMCERTGVVQCLIKGDEVYKAADKSDREALEALKGMNLLSELEMNKGEAVLTCQTLFTSDSAKKKYEKAMEAVGKISGEYAPYLSKEFFSIFANVDGAKIYDLLEDAGLTKELEDELPVNLKKMVSAIKGDVAIGLNEMDIENNKFDGALYLTTPSTDFLEGVTGAMDDLGAPLNKLGDDRYSLNLGPGAPGVLLGLDKKSSYIAVSTGSPVAFEKTKKSFTKSDIKGEGFYCFFNFSALKKMPLDGDEMFVAKEVADQLDYAEAYYDKDNKMVLRVVTNDKDLTALEVLVKVLKKFS